jgi:hypothetical protein
MNVRSLAVHLMMATLMTLLAVATASAITITDFATGSGDPSNVVFPATSTDGDFTYSGNAIATAVGDGNDETVTWTFDFTADPDYPFFPALGPLTSALLTMTLTPQNGLISTDLVRIETLGNVITPIIQTLPVGTASTISIELLDFYTSGEILGALSANAGSLPMVYGDDSLFTFAQLDLTAAPEPATLMLLACGLALTVARARRRALRSTRMNLF